MNLNNHALPENCSVLNEDKNLISLLPLVAQPKTLLACETLPCHQAKIENRPIDQLLKQLQRKSWIEGLFVNKPDLGKLICYQNTDGSFKHDFTATQFLAWAKSIAENTAICDMENRTLGKGVFVPAGKTLPAGTFIISSGIIHLNPSKADLETKVHCSALQDYNSPERKIYGIIDPEVRGGILDLINHAPNKDELANFTFKKQSVMKNVATANLRSKIKYYHGYAIMGVEVISDIEGGEFGTQLLWSYALPDEYVTHDEIARPAKTLLLFDNRPDHNGEIINPDLYQLKDISIFFDTGELIFHKVATMTRWELMESAAETGLVITTEDPYSSMQSEAIQSPIPHGFLQDYLKKNPEAERMIIKVPAQNTSKKPIAKNQDLNDRI
jgi:hypothetical protein